MLTLKIAFRNIFRQRRRTFLTILTMFGGFVLAAFSIGWADGTYNHIIDMFTRNRLGHIQIHKDDYLDRPTLYKTIANYDYIRSEITGVEHVIACTARLYAMGLGSVRDKSAGIRIIGIDPALENEATFFDRKLTNGRTLSNNPNNEAVLGRGLAKILAAAPGDELVIVSQGADGSIANDLYTIVGIMEGGDFMHDQTACYLHLSDAQNLLVLDGRVHELAIVVDNLNSVKDATARIAAVLTDSTLNVAPWQQFAKSFYHAMQADKKGNWVSLGVIILIVAVGVLNTVLMTVLERTREYGVLRAIGTGPGQIFRLVILEVFIMAVISLLIGSVLALGVNYYFSLHGIPLPESIDYGGVKFSESLTEINAQSFYLPGLAVLLSSFLVSLFPALKAAHIAPAKAMRAL
jgi:ABC-type lipoprotein release transport system permease subunit